MASAPGDAPHPDVEEVADLLEDLLTAERAAQVRAHLADCPPCADVLASLTEVAGLLGTLPDPGPMPDDVADRVDAALAAEAVTARATAAEAAEAAKDGTAASDPGVQRDVPRGTSTDGGSGVPRGTSGGSPGRPTAGRGAGATTRPGGPTGPSGSSRVGGPGRSGRRRLAGLAAVWAVGFLALGGIIYAATEAGNGSAERRTGASARRVVPAPQSTAIEDQVHRLLANADASMLPDRGTTEAPRHDATPNLEGTGPGTASTAPQDSPDHGPRSTATPVDVPSCVLKATHRSQTPLAVGRDTFQGHDSYLVVLPHPASSSLVDAYIVGASCTDDAPGAVLFQDSYPRQ